MVTKFKKVSVTESMHKRLSDDRDNFAKKIGIHFSINDTINELYNIIDNNKKK